MSNETYVPTGRRMSRPLEHALDSLAHSDQFDSIESALAQCAADDGPLSNLYLATLLECRIARARTDDTLRGLAQASGAEFDEPPPPPITPAPWTPTDEQ